MTGEFGRGVTILIMEGWFRTFCSCVQALSPIVWTRWAQACFMLVRLGFLVSLLALFPLQMGPFRSVLARSS